MSERPVDPWSDMPRWSDGEAAAAGHEPAAAGEEPAADPVAAAAQVAPPEAASAPDAATCPWCATPAADGASRCTSCGAALAQRESIGDLVIPGLTAVDPALKDLDGRPLHLSGPSPSHGVASGVVVAAAAGGPLGLAILGGVGAVAAAEYLGASRGLPGAKGHDNVGETSEAVRQALERLERGESLPTAADETPRPAGDARPAPEAPADAPQSAPGDDRQEASDGG